MGELRERRRVAVQIIAALGGMVAPAFINGRRHQGVYDVETSQPRFASRTRRHELDAAS
jgi:hypothetical protein